MLVVVQQSRLLKSYPMIAAEYFGVWNHAPGGPPAYGMYARNVKGLNITKCPL